VKNLYFDIETIPSQIPGILDEFKAAVTAPAQYKKADSIAEWLRENRDAEAERQWLNTSFDGGLGQVCVIAFALDDSDPISYAVDDLSIAAERKVLQDFFCAVLDAGTGPRFIGHNVIGFDIRFLWQRAMVLGVRPPFRFPRDPKPWSDQAFDTMTAWSGVKDRISMDRLCRIFGIDGKGDMDGSKVWPMVRDGRIAEVADYCCGDVRRARALFKRMTFAEVA
jgi:hypothetical protein